MLTPGGDIQVLSFQIFGNASVCELSRSSTVRAERRERSERSRSVSPSTSALRASTQDECNLKLRHYGIFKILDKQKNGSITTLGLKVNDLLL